MDELWTAYRARPDDSSAVSGLITALTERGDEVPVELEEQLIALRRREQPDDPQLIDAHLAVLFRQGKPVPPELEECSLRQMLARDDENEQAIRALVALYLRTGRPVPADLERKSLLLALAERPSDPELLRALAAVRPRLNASEAQQEPSPAPSPVAEAPTMPAAGTLEALLGRALASRPSDSYLLAQLIGEMLNTGRIAADTPVTIVLERLPSVVQTSEPVVAAILSVVERQRRPR